MSSTLTRRTFLGYSFGAGALMLGVTDSLAASVFQVGATPGGKPWQPGVYLDHAFRYAIRAVRMSTAGERRGLSDETITAALAEADVEESVEVHSGGGQTDFAPTSLSKGTGLRALARALGEPADGVRPLAFAMGDAWPDVPMLALAVMPFVPPNMGKGLRDELRASLGATVVQDPHGAGLLQAVRSFLGHDPRRCPTCAPPRLSGRQKVVLTAFAGSDGPRRTRVRQAAALASSLGSVSFRRATDLESRRWLAFPRHGPRKAGHSARWLRLQAGSGSPSDAGMRPIQAESGRRERAIGPMPASLHRGRFLRRFL